MHYDRLDAMTTMIEAADMGSGYICGDLDAETVAREWMALGLSVEETEDWIKAGAFCPDATAEMIGRGLTAEQAATCEPADGRPIAECVCNGDMSIAAALAIVRNA